MSLVLNRGSALQQFEHGNTVKICKGIMFDFYPGLPHMDVSLNYCAKAKDTTAV